MLERHEVVPIHFKGHDYVKIKFLILDDIFGPVQLQ